MFHFRTKEQRIYYIKIKLAGMEKELEVLWKFENKGGYLTGKRSEIIALEINLAKTKKKLELLNEI